MWHCFVDFVTRRREKKCSVFIKFNLPFNKGAKETRQGEKAHERGTNFSKNKESVSSYKKRWEKKGSSDCSAMFVFSVVIYDFFVVECSTYMSKLTQSFSLLGDSLALVIIIMKTFFVLWNVLSLSRKMSFIMFWVSSFFIISPLNNTSFTISGSARGALSRLFQPRSRGIWEKYCSIRT